MGCKWFIFFGYDEKRIGRRWRIDAKLVCNRPIMKLIFQSNPIGKGFDFFARYGTSSMRDPNDSVAHRRTSKAIRRNPTASMKKSPWNIESRGHEIDFKYWTKHRRACCFLLRCLWFIHFSFIPRPTADLHGRPLGFGWFISARLLFFFCCWLVGRFPSSSLLFICSFSVLFIVGGRFVPRTPSRCDRLFHLFLFFFRYSSTIVWVKTFYFFALGIRWVCCTVSTMT